MMGELFFFMKACLHYLIDKQPGFPFGTLNNICRANQIVVFSLIVNEVICYVQSISEV